MSTDRKLSLAALLVGLLTLGLWLFGGGKSIETVREIVREVVGATSDQFPELRIGGVKYIAQRQDMVASNTPCALRVNSTSTVDRVTIQQLDKFSDTATANSTWIVSTSTARTATGTQFFSMSSPETRGLTAVALGQMPGTTTPGSTGTVNGSVFSTTTVVTLRPNDWINVNVVSPSFAASEVRGTCNFILQEL